jgi:hypothetical protein
MLTLEMVLAKVYQVALATYRAACQRRPGIPIAYVRGAHGRPPPQKAAVLAVPCTGAEGEAV